MGTKIGSDMDIVRTILIVIYGVLVAIGVCAWISMILIWSDNKKTARRSERLADILIKAAPTIAILGIVFIIGIICDYILN